MLRFDVVTIFPKMVAGLIGEGLIHRAQDRGLLTVKVHDLRDFTDDRHRVVDDIPYGGGPGMVLKPEPLLRAVEFITAESGNKSEIVLTSPQGRRFSHNEALRLSRMSHITLLCGRYEGVDERVKEQISADELSIGDYVLSGGELPAMVILEAVSRLVPGVVGDQQSVLEDSFVRSLLDFPHYTRPAQYGDMNVPSVLLSGNHSEIKRWRKREAVRRTLERRPDLLTTAELDGEEQEFVHEWLKERETGVKI